MYFKNTLLCVIIYSALYRYMIYNVFLCVCVSGCIMCVHVYICMYVSVCVYISLSVYQLEIYMAVSFLLQPCGCWSLVSGVQARQ